MIVPALRTRLGIILCILMGVICPRIAAAHGGGPGLDYDPCARYAGIDNYVHFSAYQPQYNRFAEYCGSLPRGGNTLLVFDLVGPELLYDPVEVEIVPEGGSPAISLPAKRYPTGVIDIETNLDPGHYDAFLTIGEAPTVYHVNFDLSVGSWWQPLIAPLIIASLILLGAIGYCIYQARALAGETRTSAPAALPSIKSA
ncbi:MAG TPA: hypothetical protein VMT61_01310 [Candidatus Binataceae bacterium]|nr:hypothetical protein [Candidatus Binataceae bacterium]